MYANRVETNAIAIPLWYIISPLTLISSCLLLAKARNSTSRKIEGIHSRKRRVNHVASFSNLLLIVQHFDVSGGFDQVVVGKFPDDFF